MADVSAAVKPAIVWWLSIAAICAISTCASGCQFLKETGGDVGGTVADAIACPTDLIDCGHVYMCEAYANNALGHVEICIDDDDHPEDVDAVEMAYGQCEPTPRHQGLCLFCCGPDCGRGGNAYSGTWCEGH